MAKSKQPSASLKGKRPINKAKSTTTSTIPLTRNPGHIRNKIKRSEMYGKYLLAKKTHQRNLRLKRAKEAEELGVDVATTKQTPKTLDNTREMEPTMVPREGDVEVEGDEAGDEFVDYFEDVVRPKIVVTTRPKPSKKLFYFIGDLMRFVPRLYYYPRKHFSVKEICEFAKAKDFTHLIVLSEKSKVCNGMIISHLRSTGIAAAGKTKNDVPNHDTDDYDMKTDEYDDSSSSSEDQDEEKKESTTDEPKDDNDDDDDDGDNNDIEEESKNINYHSGGPTAFFKVSNVVSSNDVPYHGSATSHVPELVLNGFGTRLGRRVGRFLGSIFPHNAEFQGRQVATFHNQRDYIFVRHHRYVFEEGKEAFVEKKDEEGGSDGKKEGDGGENGDGEEDSEDDGREKKEKKEKKKTKARLQELGPRFTLKLRWLQEGMFDTHFGEYEWFHKRKEMDVSRRKFHL